MTMASYSVRIASRGKASQNGGQWPQGLSGGARLADFRGVILSVERHEAGPVWVGRFSPQPIWHLKARVLHDHVAASEEHGQEGRTDE